MTKKQRKMKAKKCVAAGATFLDQHKPKWRKKVDPDDLDIECSSYCILGQVFGDYYDGLTKLGIHANMDAAQMFGFLEEDGLTRRVDAELLEKYWKKEIKKPGSVQEMCC